jgi:manganese/zinc-transporting P-type ATPase C
MQFMLVHEIQGARGRLRARAIQPMTKAFAAVLLAQLSAIEGIEEPSINARTGSVLFFYLHGAARQQAFVLLCQPVAFLLHRADAGQVMPAAPAAPAEQGALRPLVQYFIVRPLLPMLVRMASTLWRAVPYVRKALGALFQAKFSVELLDGTAIVVSLLLGDFKTARMMLFLLGIGETLEQWTRKKSLASLTESLALQVDQVWLVQEGVERAVPLSEVRHGDVLVVRDGGVIPVDGTVVQGEALVNQASMTGEPLGIARTVGASVFAGTVVEEGVLHIQVSHVGEGTRLQQVITFINESETLKASVQSKSERLADKAVPFTFLLSGLVWLITRNPMRAASVLLVDYSCALKMATPLAILTAMREAAQHGVLIKGGRFLEALHEADTIVFDKTGTLTQAQPSVVQVLPAHGFERDEILRISACLEEHFPHPVARAVVRQAAREGLNHEEEHAEVEYIVAHGIASSLHGRRVLIGSRHYIAHDEGIDLSPLEQEIAQMTDQGYSLLYLSIGNRLAGIIAIEDPVRPEAAQVVQALRQEGVKRIVMLTGDDARTAAAVAAKLGISEYWAQVLPAEKAGIVRKLADEGHTVMMVGDGINDAPALSAAHVGISLRDGADLAQEVANVVLLHSQLESLLHVRRLAKATLRRIHTNFVATMSLNSAFLAGGLAGVLTPASSALLHNASTVGIALLAMRSYHTAPHNEHELAVPKEG